MWVYIWVAVILLAIVVEIATVELVGIWFVPGALIALVLALFGVHWAIQVGVFVIATVLFIIFFRKKLMQYLSKDKSKTNTDLLIGKELKLITPIAFQTPGSVKINGVVWSASLEDETAELKEGSLVKVVEIKGNKLIVKEVK